jgi:hypothetical protein
LMPVGVYAVLPRVSEPLLAHLGQNPFRRQLPYRDSAAYFLQPWKTGDDGARRFAEQVLKELPPRAVLIADQTPGAPLLCLQRVEGRRPDVVLEAAGFDREPEALPYWSSPADRLPQAAKEGRRVFVVSDHPDYRPLWVRKFARLEPFGCTWEVVPRAPEAGP